jgi:hypothetical protein
MDVILQWLPTLITLGLFVLAVIKSPGERLSLSSGAVKAYAEAAQMAQEDAKEAREEAKAANDRAKELEGRVLIVERKRYRVTVEFEIGDPANSGIVKIEPVIPDVSLPVTKTIKRKPLL